MSLFQPPLNPYSIPIFPRLPQQPLPLFRTSHPPLPPHSTQMLQHRLIRIQKPLDAILRAALLPSFQLPT